MDSETISIYIKNIETLTDATRSGVLKWKKQNPTTFFYESKLADGEFVTSIQNVSFSGKYVFQIIEAETKEVVLDLIDEPERLSLTATQTVIDILNKATQAKKPAYGLKELYNTVDKVINNASIKVFDDIIKNMNK